jgi:hypothetical protein
MIFAQHRVDGVDQFVQPVQIVLVTSVLKHVLQDFNALVFPRWVGLLFFRGHEGFESLSRPLDHTLKSHCFFFFKKEEPRKKLHLLNFLFLCGLGFFRNAWCSVISVDGKRISKLKVHSFLAEQVSGAVDARLRASRHVQ